VEGEQRTDLLAEVRPLLVTMRRYSSAYSKHLLAGVLPSSLDTTSADKPTVERLLDHEIDPAHATAVAA
jgi:hypothetical protein